MGDKRNAYLAQLRGLPDEWDKGKRFGGNNINKGCEAMIATEQGAIVVRVWRSEHGQEHVKVDLILWKRYTGEMVGRTELLYRGILGDGSCYDEMPVLQPKLFQEESE